MIKVRVEWLDGTRASFDNVMDGEIIPDRAIMAIKIDEKIGHYLNVNATRNITIIKEDEE